MNGHCRLLKRVFISGMLVILAGCVTELPDNVLGTPSDIRIIYQEFSSETLSLLERVSYGMLVVGQCQGVKLRYVENGGSGACENCVEPEKFYSAVLDDVNFNPPWKNSEDGGETREEIIAAFNALEKSGGNLLEQGRGDLTGCRFYPWEKEGEKWLLIALQHHGERSSVSGSVPFRFVMFRGRENKLYRKVLDIYTNIPCSKWCLVNGSWCITGGMVGKECWKIVVD